MRIVIVPNQTHTPAGKLADAELHFDSRDGRLLDGLKFVGFAIWESQWPTKHAAYPHLRVTVPARQYDAGGQRKTFNLVRAAQESQVRGVETGATAALTDAILDAYAQALDRAPARVQAATAVARQVAHTAQRPASRPAPSRVAAGGRYPLRAPSAPPEPPPHTDDDYPF